MRWQHCADCHLVVLRMRTLDGTLDGSDRNFIGEHCGNLKVKLWLMVACLELTSHRRSCKDWARVADQVFTKDFKESLIVHT